MSQYDIEYFSDNFDGFEDFDAENSFSGADEGVSGFTQDSMSNDTLGAKIAKNKMNYSIISTETLERRKGSFVEEVSALIGLEGPTTQLLLQCFRWNQELLFEKFMDAPEKVAKEFGISLEHSGKTIETETNFKCMIMREEGEMDTFSLSCGHKYCTDCYRIYLEGKIAENRTLIKCPDYKCKLLIDEQAIELLVDESVFLLYKQKVVSEYVNFTHCLKWCPAPNCSYAIECSVSPSSLSHTIPVVRCKCNQAFCFGCGEVDHSPALCKMRKLWEEKCQNDSETHNWILSYTKDCPKCKTAIEKNGGCNHMSCTKCRYEFCWVCLGDWKLHKDNYKCNVYKGPADDGAVASSRDSLERYLHHFTRFNNHERSIKLTNNLILKTNQNINAVQRKTTLSWIELYFLRNAVNVLTEARTVLEWTYVFAFFLKKNNYSIIFEGNQSDLESAVEQLSGIVEAKIDPENIDEIRKNVLNLSYYVSNRQQVLLEDVYSGYLDDRWEFAVNVQF